MDTEQDSNNHRGSVSSSRSLEIPATPSRSPKKVSFSDELPQSQTPAQQPVQQQPAPTGVSHVLQQAAQYLERLHGARDTPEEKAEEVQPDGDSSDSSLSEPAVLDLDAVDLSANEAAANVGPIVMASSPSILVASVGKQEAIASANVNGNGNPNQRQSNLYMERYNLNLDKNCSSMELEARREKQRWLLISECSAIFDEGEGKHTREAFRKLFLDEEFQQKLFQLFDLERNGYLLQDRWIEHLKGRLTDDRQMDFAEQIESVAYVICGENKRVTFKNFRDIWHTRGILDKLYRLIEVDGSNLISTNQVMEFISHLTNSRPRTGFDKSSLARLEQLFRTTVGNEQEIRREEFQKIVTSKNPFFTERVFQIFDKDNSGSISLQEFIDAIHQFSGQSADDKIRFLFKVYDIDGDGLIQHKELHDVIRHCIKENGMEFSEDQIEDLTSAMFEDADPHNSGEITYEALKNQLHKHGGLLENLSITIDRWLVPIAEDRQAGGAAKSGFWNSLPHQFSLAYMKNNQVFVTYLFFYITVNLCLFISRAIQYRASNGFVIIARACGQCLNFNCAWVLVLMLRHSLTYLRGRGLSSYLPLDHHVYLHKLTGITISVFSLVHTIMHLFNFSIIVINDPNINAGHYTIGEWLLTDRPGLFGLIPGCANPTGVALLAILVVMFVCSQPFVRRKGSFEVFYWTHLLYVPFWILCLFHGPNFWKWFLLPGLVYIVERALRFIWMRGEHGKTYISSGLLLPSKVVHLVIKRPHHFNFRPGDYVFVNIPAIANYEWHPFTISSAPEQEDYMWLHIRTVGEWTNRLYRYFEREQQKLQQNGSSQEIPQHMHAIPTPSFMLLNEARNPAMSGERSATPQTDFLAKNLAVQAVPPVRPPRQNRKPTTGTAPETPVTGVNRIRSIKKTLQRTFSRKEAAEPKKGMSNGSFLSDGDREDPNLKQRPLEKSISLPDISVKSKKRSRLKALRALGRSESESAFDEKRVRRARNNSVGLAYLSPQNKSLAQSFRYMRTKPTIIAFKTPSMEEREHQLSAGEANGASPASRAEQGQLGSKMDPVDKLQVARLSLAAEVASKPLEDQTQTGSGSRKSILRRPTFLRTLSTSINNRTGGGGGGSTGSSTTNSGGKVTLDAGVMEIFIDGPYGAPSSHIFGAQHAVLIGTGIGVTPFASILQSIMHRYWKARHSCPRCQFEWASEIPKSVMNLRKVDFFWINRDQRSFEWFVNLLSQLEIEQAELGGAMERFLDMHMYITSALQRTDMKAVGLQLALDLLHEKGKRDLITGLKTRTNAGRPNWDKVFKQLQAQQKGKVTVFYCGPPQLAKTLRYKCDQYGFAFRKECF
ncbi:NADPH oxidase 5 isoform X1 [Drosophila eugracilis]|uniref:NADPH oxidase 5 isoform X1 n=1 Tax=Drosophila eugracilis TaxID=29029 RepID=UPI0007E79F11|nr:NADPH oxidase 5 isoform X1 [Drosophila eugracilis]